MPEAVEDLARPRTVTRRDELVYDGTGPRPVSPQGETVAVVRLAIQRESRGTYLVRQSDGDETATQIRVWVSDADLAAAYSPDDPNTPLGWTSLRVAPPEGADGPPGDLIDWQGRRFEVTAIKGWDEFFDGEDAGFQRYIAEERGATP